MHKYNDFKQINIFHWMLRLCMTYLFIKKVQSNIFTYKKSKINILVNNHKLLKMKSNGICPTDLQMLWMG